ncbi:MAG: LPS export ABC transporter permease LptF [Rhodospirillaceae bacterium]|jgi:lipopolysaccharide export system permease protein|nr:LPS export ABC transporter permease LptF [Rhodospirillaceae bacterium]
MNGLNRYILRHLIVGTLLVSGVLAYILWLTQSLGYIEMIINKGLSIGTWLELTLLLMPNVMVIILPISLFLVVLFTYNKMTVDRELVVAQAAGISQWGLAFPAIVVAVLTTAAAYTLTLYYGPMSVRAFKELQWSVRSDVSQVILREGTFNQVGKGLTIYVRERGPEGDLRGLLVHDNRDEIKSITMMAENGAVVSGPDGPRVILSKGSRQELTRGEGDLTLLYFDRYTVDLGLIELTGDARFKDNRERSTAELFTLSEADGIKPRNIRRMRVEGHQRLTNPLWNLSLAAVALAFILTGTFNRHGQVKRISVAILCTVIIETAGLGAASLASKNLLFVPLLYLVAFVPFGLGLFVLSGKSYQALLPFSLRPHPGSV